MNLRIKRVYEPPDGQDGRRILVDRLWPRGLSKEKASIDLWLKDLAPSTELRKWFGHDPHRWEEFRERYHAELNENSEQILRLKQELDKGGIVTLVYGAKDAVYNHALVIREHCGRNGLSTVDAGSPPMQTNPDRHGGRCNTLKLQAF